MADDEIPQPIQKIIEREHLLFENRDPMPDVVPPKCEISFIYEHPTGAWITLADLSAAGALPIPAKGEVIVLHDEYVKIVKVSTVYTTAEDGPIRGRAEVFTTITVEPPDEP